MRTMNNLLERLHASYFFYILAGANGNHHPDSRYFRPTFSHFLKIGSYLPSAILISVAMMFGGLKEWTDAGWILESLGEEFAAQKTEDKSTPSMTWRRRKRPVMTALAIMAATHAAGGLLLWTIRFAADPIVRDPFS